MILKKYILLGFGFLFLLLGAIGIAVPVLPTTPFVILASGCFAYGSPALLKWLEGTKYFGEFISNYRTKTGVQKSVKIKALIFLYATLGISFFLMPLWYVRLILFLVAAAVTVHILLIKTKEA